MSFIYDVGISYAGTQNTIAKHIYDELWKRGYSVFYDRERTEHLVGGHLRTNLAQTFAQDCRVCVLLLSPEYEQSEWTLLERKAILERETTEERPAFPVLLAGAPPSWLDDLCTLDFRTNAHDAATVAEMVVDTVASKTLPSASHELGPIADRMGEYLEGERNRALLRTRWTRSFEVDLFALPIRLFPKQPEVAKNGVRCVSDFSKLRYRRIALLGRPGSGKSTLVERIFATSVGQARLIPVNVRQWNLAESAPVLRERLKEQLHLRSTSELALLEEKSPLLLVFDGLDETSNPRDTLRRLEFITNSTGFFPSAHLLVTCRTEDYPEPESQVDICELSIDSLTDDDRRRFFAEMRDGALAERVRAAFSANPEIAAMCSNQFVFLMLVRVFRRTKHLPGTRAEVYKRFLKDFLCNWAGLGEMDSGRLLEVVEHIAVRIARSDPNATSISIATLKEEMGIGDEEIAAFRSHGLLVKCHTNSVKFVQRTLQEYLHAKWLYDTGVSLKEFLPTTDGEYRAKETWVSRNTAGFCLEIPGLLGYVRQD